MTPRTRTEPRPTPLRSPHQAVGLFLGAAVLAVLIVAPSLGAGGVVPRLRIDNPTPFAINVDLAGGEGGGWFHLGTVAPEGGSLLEEVADPGATWAFRFTYAGVDAGELQLRRSELQGAGWQFAIPADAGPRLAAAGLEESAR